MASTFFMLISTPSSLDSTKNTTVCLQRRLKRRSSYKLVRQPVKFAPDSNLKIKWMKAQALVNDESRVTSMIESLKDEDLISPSGTMELLTSEGRLVEGGRAFQQNHFIRTFEIDPDYRLSTRAIMNFLQEASLHYRKKMGMSSDALLGITPEMRKRDLLWVFRTMRIEVDRYPSWADVIQVTHRICTSGRIGMRFDWLISDIKTCETLTRASCLAVMMNKKTRKTCKLPEEVKGELSPFLSIDAEPIVKAVRNSSPDVDTMNYVRNGLTPGWHDLDFNYHVNNAKYLDWILESTPCSLICSHELSTINLEYRKECLKDDVIQSLSKVVTKKADLSIKNLVELEHLLRLENGSEVARARTTWRLKSFGGKTYN